MPAVMTSTRSGRGALGAPHERRAAALAAGVRASRAGGGLRVGGAGEQHRSGARIEQLGDDRRALLGRLARAVHRLGATLAQRAVVVDAGEAEIGVRQAPQPCDRVVRRHRAGADVVEQTPEGRFVHVTYPAPSCPAAADSAASGGRLRVGYLGPPGTFTEQALLTQPDLARASSSSSPRSPT